MFGYCCTITSSSSIYISRGSIILHHDHVSFMYDLWQCQIVEAAISSLMLSLRSVRDPQFEYTCVAHHRFLNISVTRLTTKCPSASKHIYSNVSRARRDPETANLVSVFLAHLDWRRRKIRPSRICSFSQQPHTAGQVATVLLRAHRVRRATD